MAGKLVGSRKAEKNAFNMGDEQDYSIVDEEEAQIQYYEKQFLEEGGTKRAPKQDFKQEKLTKEQREQEEYLRRKRMGAEHVQIPLSHSERKRKNKAEKFAQLEADDFLREKERKRQEQIERKRMLKSSAYKKQQWEEKRERRRAFETEFEVNQKELLARQAELKQAIDRHARQNRIDESWESEDDDLATGKPKPKPKAKVDPRLARLGVDPAKMKQKVEAGKGKKKLAWDPEKGDKDPKRADKEKQEENAQWGRDTKEMEEVQVRLTRLRTAFEKQKEVYESEGYYAHSLESEPEFETDPESESSSSDSDSSDSDSD